MTMATRRSRLVLARPAIIAATVVVAGALIGGLLWRGEWPFAIGAVLLGALALRAGASHPDGSGDATAAGDRSPANGPDMLPASPDPIVAVDRRGAVTAVNTAARALIPALRTGEPLALALRAPDVLGAIRTVAHGHGPPVPGGTGWPIGPPRFGAPR